MPPRPRAATTGPASDRGDLGRPTGVAQPSVAGSSAWFANIEGEVPDDADGTFSVIDELSEAGGPDLRAPEPDITQKPDDLNQTPED